MKTLILICLVVLALSSPPFVRRTLQSSTTTTITNVTNVTNSTNATNVTNTTAAQINSSQILSNFTYQTFSLAGNWTLQNTNCTDRQNCTPQYYIYANTSTLLTITVTYPNDSECGNFTGQVVTQAENVDLGMWYDTNVSSPLYGWLSILRLNNFTSLILRNDTGVNGTNATTANNISNTSSNASVVMPTGFTPIVGLQSVLNGTSSQHVCFEEWANPLSIFTNATGALPPTVWEGAWTLTNIVADPSVTQCCVPAVPPIAYDDEVSQNVIFVWALPNCTACGHAAGAVMNTNTSVLGGAAIDSDAELFIYLINNQSVIAVDTECAFVYQRVTSNSCTNPQVYVTPINSSNSSSSNSTNSTVPANSTIIVTSNVTNTTTVTNVSNSTGGGR